MTWPDTRGMDVEIIDTDGTVIAVLPNGAHEVYAKPPREMVEDLFRARDELEAAIDSGLEDLFGPIGDES